MGAVGAVLYAHAMPATPPRADVRGGLAPPTVLVVYAALTVVGLALYVAAIHAALGDPRGELAWPPVALLGAVALPTAWLVLEPLLSPARSSPLTSLARTVWGPIVPAIGQVVIGLVLVFATGLPAAMTAARAARHGLLRDLDLDPVPLLVAVGPLMGLLAGMTVGLVLSVAVVLPAYAFLLPEAAMAANDYDTGEEATPANTVAIRALAILLIIVFASPTLIIAGAAGPGWVPILGWALLPIGIALIVWIRRIQRPHDPQQP